VTDDLTRQKQIRALVSHAVNKKKEPKGWYLWWRLRGVTVDNYRRCCCRCGRTGQAHWPLLGCWRFKDPA